MSVTSIDFVFGNDYYQDKPQEEAKETLSDISTNKEEKSESVSQEAAKIMTETLSDEQPDVQAFKGKLIALTTANQVTNACYQTACV